MKFGLYNICVWYYNLLGAKVFTVKNMSNPQSIYLEQLKNGVYIVVEKVSGKTFSRKILIGGLGNLD